MRRILASLFAFTLIYAPAMVMAQDTAPAPTIEETAAATAPAAAADSPASQATVTVAKQAIVLDADTGLVLFEKNADERMPPSSMSKEMTMYMVFEALKNGKLTMEQNLPVSEKAWRIQGSKMFVPIGGQVKVEDLIRGVVVQSGNDAATVLAEGIGGSEEMFAEMMNKKAKELGMNNSNFVNASGWPDPNHYTTARDLSTLALHQIRDFPEYYHYYSERDFTYNGIKQGNRNPLLYRGGGGDGIKTGHTEDGGYGLIGSGTQNGRRIILVLNGMSSMQERADESVRLLEWGLKNFTNVKIFSKGDTVDSVAVVMGVAESVPLVVDQDILFTLPLSARNDLKAEAVYEGPLKAPVNKGDILGKLIVNVPNAETLEVPLLAGADVPQLGFFAGLGAKIKYKLSGGPKTE